MRLFLFFLALVPTFADAKFGTEIELMGRRHRKDAACFAGSSAAGLVAAGAGVGAVVADDERLAVVSMAGLSVPVLCYAFSHVVNHSGTTYLHRIEEQLARRSPHPKVERIVSGTFKEPALAVTYENGAQVLFTQDHFVIEVKTILKDAADAAAKQAFLDKEIYDLGRRVGLRPPKRDGIFNAGHVHLDIGEAFGGDPKAFKRFVMDLWARPELFSGVLGHDPLSARPFNPRNPLVQEEVDRFAKSMDEWLERRGPFDRNAIYDLHHEFPKLFNKHRVLNLKPQLGTLEIRGLRSQANAGTLASLLKLLEAQVAYTKKLPDRSFAALVNTVPKVRSHGAKGRNFRRWVERTGLRYEEMAPLAPADFRLRNFGACPEVYRRLRGGQIH